MIYATITPNNYYMPFKCVECWLGLAMDRGNPKFVAYSGSTLHHNRNLVFQEAKKDGDDLFFIDSDIVFDPQDVVRLETLLQEKDIVTGVYSLFDTDHFSNILDRVKDGYVNSKPSRGINEIGACGMGFCAISKRVIQALDDEPFNPFTEGKVQHGEDVSFCHRARLKGFTIWCDSSVNVGQVRSHTGYYKKS